MKAYTDLEQSKKLAKILPIESADMYWENGVSDKYFQCFTPFVRDATNMDYDYDVPCWSLAALYSILPNNKKESTTLSRGGWKIEPIEYMPNTWWCEYEDNENPTESFNTSADNPIDACVDMIIKLHERKML